jgi:hypothetical protein
MASGSPTLLERVGIAYVNADGIADFHAVGHDTHMSELLRNGRRCGSADPPRSSRLKPKLRLPPSNSFRSVTAVRFAIVRA